MIIDGWQRHRLHVDNAAVTVAVCSIVIVIRQRFAFEQGLVRCHAHCHAHCRLVSVRNGRIGGNGGTFSFGNHFRVQCRVVRHRDSVVRRRWRHDQRHRRDIGVRLPLTRPVAVVLLVVEEIIELFCNDKKIRNSNVTDGRLTRSILVPKTESGTANFSEIIDSKPTSQQCKHSSTPIF